MNDMLKIEVLRNAFVACGIPHEVIKSDTRIADTAIKVEGISFYFDIRGDYIKTMEDCYYCGRPDDHH